MFRRAAWLVHLALFLAGWMAADLDVRSPSPADVSRVLSREREYAMAIGVVTADPVPVRPGDEPTWSAPLKLEGLSRLDTWQRVRGTVKVRWRAAGENERLQYGDRLLVAGPFVRPDDGSPIQFFADPRASRRLEAGRGWSVMAWCLRGRDACARVLSRGIAGYETESNFIRAMMLGFREDLPDPIFRAFAETGTLHIVAISGTHVAVAALIFAALLRASGMSQRYWVAVLAPLLVLYTLGTGMSSSAIRACVMALVFWSSIFFLRKADGLTALAFSALVILAVSPSQLADAGFLLSFGIVAGFMAFYRPIVKPLDPLWEPDPWRLQPEARPVRAMRAAGKAVAMLLGASVVAWLISTPMTALLFHNVSPVSLLANLVVIPLSSAMLMTGFLALATGWWLPFAGEVFNHANRVLAWLILRAVEGFNRAPGGNVYLAPIAWTWVAVWYAALTAIVLGQGRLRRAGVVGAAAAAAVAAILYVSDRDARVSVFGTGRVAVALCDVPGGDDVLVNAGDANVARRVVHWMREQGVDHLGAVVLSAPTADVAGGVPVILEQIPVKELWVGSEAARSRVFRRALEQAKARGTSVKILASGDRGRLGGGVEWEVLHAAHGPDGTTAADGALVLRFAREASSVVVRSPGTDVQEATMLAQGIEQSAGVAVLGGVEPSATWLHAAGDPVVVNPAAWEEAVVVFDDEEGAYVANY
jgi:ComEC/Rec2-related protein